MEVKTDRFKKDLPKYIHNDQLRQNVKKATFLTLDKRENLLQEFPDWQEMRNRLASIKTGIVNNLEEHLRIFRENLQKNGIQVMDAADARQANQLVMKIIREHKGSLVVKSKSMVTEEIGLNHYLEENGLEVLETDLGEYILQLAHEEPSHLIGPAIHKSRQDIARLFHEKLGVEYNDSPEYLTGVARAILRDKFWAADIGITGANAGLVEDGAIVLVENEGNARFSIASPRVHIIIMGIEKLLHNIKELPLFLTMLCVSASGVKMTGYVSVVRGPRKEHELDGPEHVYLILLDNGRRKIWQDERMREALRCIRCSACYNTCPIYRNVGGHAYGWVYQGPIGAVITPHLVGLEKARDLPFASTLCGSCSDICPVKIPLHHLLLYNRYLLNKNKRFTVEKMAFQGFKWLAGSRGRYELLSKLGRKLVNKLQIKPKFPGWSTSREFPAPAGTAFRDWYRNKSREGRHE